MPATRKNPNLASQAPKPSKKPCARRRKQSGNRPNEDANGELAPSTEEAGSNEEEAGDAGGGGVQNENAADPHDTNRTLEALQG